MARDILVSDVIQRIRWRCGQDKSAFIQPDEVLAYVDSAAAELYDILVDSFADYFIDFSEFSTLAGVDLYQLPANFYKIRGVDVLEGSLTHSLKKFNFEERSRFINSTLVSPMFSNLKYCLLGNTILFAPMPTAGLDMRLYYVPALPRITSTNQTLSMFSGYEEFIISTVCIRIATKAEEDPLPYERERERQRKRIELAAQLRDVGDAGVPIDSAGHESYMVPPF